MIGHIFMTAVVGVVVSGSVSAADTLATQYLRLLQLRRPLKRFRYVRSKDSTKLPSWLTPTA